MRLERSKNSMLKYMWKILTKSAPGNAAATSQEVVHMLKKWVPEVCPEEKKLKERLEAAEHRLSVLQMKIKEHKLPVLVLVEGFGAAGKGSAIGAVIKNIDPRFFNVATMSAPSEEEKRRPFLYRYFVQIPEAGKFTFLNSGWADEICRARQQGELTDEEYLEKVDSVKRFERQLTDNGYLVMKFFFHISQKEQKKRIEGLLEKKDTAWRVSAHDKWQNKHYGECLDTFDQYMTDTGMPAAPWYVIDAQKRKWALLQALELLCKGIEVALQNESIAVPLLQNVFPLKQMPKLCCNLTE